MSTGDPVLPVEVKVGDHIFRDGTWHLVTGEPTMVNRNETSIATASSDMPFVFYNTVSMLILNPSRWIDRVEGEIDALRVDAETLRVLKKMGQA